MVYKTIKTQTINVRLKLHATVGYGNNIIYVQFFLQQKPVFFSTRVICTTNNWSEIKMRVKSSDKQAGDKNLILEQILARVNDVMVKFRLKNRTLTVTAFMKAFRSPNSTEKFHDYCQHKLDESHDLLAPRTIMQHNNILKVLKNYKCDLLLDDITEDFILHYQAYLRRRIKYNFTTVYRHLTIIKKYTHMALREGLIEDDPFYNIHIKRGKNSNTVLNSAEFKQVVEFYRNHKFMNETMNTVLRFFVFMCFGSQHISDARAMHIEQLQGENFVYYRVKLRNVKPEPVTVPISKALRKVITEQSRGRTSGVLWDNLPADAKVNKYLKDIAAEIGIKKNVTASVGRHTFATYFLSQTRDINTLKDILGHSTLRQTLTYAHVLEDDKTKEIDCFNLL